MPSMGHGSAPTTIEVIDTGTYRVKDVSLFMPGDWELRFSTGGVNADEAVIKVSM